MVEVKNAEVHFPEIDINKFEDKDNYLKSITVFADMKGNGVFMPEFQRYAKTANCGIIMSQSTMHSLDKFMTSDEYDPFTKYVSDEIKNIAKRNYDTWKKIKNKYEAAQEDHIFSTGETKEWRLKVYNAFETLVHNLPRGFELWTTIVTNYFQLKTIVIQRKNHKNFEDWGNFVKFCYSLPKFRELCDFTNEIFDFDNLFPLFSEEKEF